MPEEKKAVMIDADTHQALFLLKARLQAKDAKEVINTLIRAYNEREHDGH